MAYYHADERYELVRLYTVPRYFTRYDINGIQAESSFRDYLFPILIVTNTAECA